MKKSSSTTPSPTKLGPAGNLEVDWRKLFKSPAVQAQIRKLTEFCLHK